MNRNSFRIVALVIATILIHQLCNAAPPTAILGAFAEETVWLDSQLVARHDTTIMGLKFSTGQLAGAPVVLALTGVGKVNAAMTTTLLIEHFQPGAVLFTGVAGSLSPNLRPGDVVVASHTIQHDLGDVRPDSMVNFGVRNPVNGERNPVFFEADSALIRAAEKAVPNVKLENPFADSDHRAGKVILSTIATGDAFVTSTPAKKKLHRNLQASAVEMEGAAVAQICYQLGVPCLVIRALSDRADENAQQDFEKYYQMAARNANRLVLEMLPKIGQEE